MSKRNKHRPIVPLVLLGGIACCIVLWLAAGFYIGVPKAISRIGTPAEDLDPLQRLFLAGVLLVNQDALDQSSSDPNVALEIQVIEGETAIDVVGRLQMLGLVRNGDLLLKYLRYRGMDRGIKAGTYHLHGGMTIREIAAQLQKSEPEEIRVTMPEGWRIEQIADSLAAAMIQIEAEEFIAVTRINPTGYSFADELPQPGSVEGFLFPDTYLFHPDATAIEMLYAMLDNFEVQVDAELQEGFSNQGLTIYQAVTLASIIEREAIVDEERPLISSVFFNRLAKGINLDADPTIQYALGLQPDGSWWKAPLTFEDLELDSPYNTYKYPGLPPGPIANPGLESMRAVAFPAKTSFLYFRAMCDGSGRHSFAETFEEHLQNACP
jgi:UPF0755 protein